MSKRMKRREKKKGINWSFKDFFRMGKTRETFEDRAERYDRMQEALFDEDSFELMLKCLTKGSGKELKEMTIIDAGCGTGHITGELAKFVRRVFGIDLAPKMLKLAKKHAKKAGQENVIFEVGDAQTLEKFSDNSIDGIVCRHTFHHFQKPRYLCHLYQFDRSCPILARIIAGLVTLSHSGSLISFIWASNTFCIIQEG